MNYVIFLSLLSAFFCCTDIISSPNKENKIPSPRKVYSSQSVMTLWCLNNNVKQYYQNVDIFACESIDHIIYDAQRCKHQSQSKQSLRQKSITGSLDTNQQLLPISTDKKQEDQVSSLEQAVIDCQMIKEAKKKVKLKQAVIDCQNTEKIKEQENNTILHQPTPKSHSLRCNARLALKNLCEIPAYSGNASIPKRIETFQSINYDPRAAYSLSKSNKTSEGRARANQALSDDL